MILAHHGELEFGSPKVPSTIDAMILYLADLSDSKLKQVEDAIDTDMARDTGQRITAF